METNGIQGHSYFFLEFLGATFHLKTLPSYVDGPGWQCCTQRAFLCYQEELGCSVPNPTCLWQVPGDGLTFFIFILKSILSPERCSSFPRQDLGEISV